MHIEMRTAEVARAGSLEETVATIGIAPIEPAFTEVHRAHELSLAPPATPCFRVLRMINAIVQVTNVVSCYAVCVSVALMLLLATWNHPLPIVDTATQHLFFYGIAVLCPGVFWAGITDHVQIRGEARWIMVPLKNATGLIPEALEKRLALIRAVFPEENLFCEQLVQDSVVLDPLWWIVRGNERVCFAITDAQKRIVRMG